MYPIPGRLWRKRRVIDRWPSLTQDIPGSNVHRLPEAAPAPGNDDENDLDEEEEEMVKKPTLGGKVFGFFYIFFNTTTIHGLSHTIALKRSYAENILWSIVVCVAIIGAVALGLNIWTRYKDNPTSITMERDYMSWNTSAPAVTFCPYTYYSEKELDKFVKSFEKKDSVNEDDLKKMLIILSNFSFSGYSNLPEISESVFPPESYLDAVFAISTKMQVNAKNSADKDLPMVESVTEMGFCLTYNTFVAQYNQLKYWKNKTLEVLTQPFSEFNGHPASGELQELFLSQGTFKYVIHSPFDVPDATRLLTKVMAGKTVKLLVEALATITTDEAKLLTVEQRKCRMAHENPLRVSPEYTYYFCQIECRIRMAYRLCRCTPFFYRRLDGMPICDVKGMKCIGKNAEALLRLTESNGDTESCKCLPRCDQINFYVDTFSMSVGFYYAGLEINIEKYPAMRLKRDVIFGFADLWVSIGGTGGLFLGCSVLSLIEIAYFLSLRLYLYARKAYLRRPRNNKQTFSSFLGRYLHSGEKQRTSR